jgi:hypothetical protein
MAAIISDHRLFSLVRVQIPSLAPTFQVGYLQQFSSSRCALIFVGTCLENGAAPFSWHSGLPRLLSL